MEEISFPSLLCGYFPKVSAIPWLANRFDESNNDDFPLPRYSSFDAEDSR